MTDFDHLPASIAAHIFSYSSSKELLQFRNTSRSFNSILVGQESEAIWQNALQKDFEFQEADVRGGQNHILQAPTINPQRQDSDGRTPQTSIFGYPFSDPEGIFRASTAFESWKHWCKASSIFYNRKESDDEIIQLLGELDGDDIEVEHTYINGPFFLRAARLWRNVFKWCSSDDSGTFGDRLMESFVGGVRHYEGRFANCKLNRPFHSYEAIFAFCDGQLSMTRGNTEMPSYREAASVGFFGGYMVYEHAQCTRLCCTRDAAITRPPGGRIVLGCNFLTRSYRVFAVNLGTYELNTMNGSGHESPAYQEGSGKLDIGLLWMEEFVNRLSRREMAPQSGILGSDYQYDWLSLFPAKGSSPASRRVTKGIEVIASSVAAFEINTVVYSIRIRLLTQGEDGYLTPEERGFDTCQLKSRHWRLTNTIQDEVDEVNGDGVVGRFPMLFEGGYRDDSMQTERRVTAGKLERGTFIYQSCAGVQKGSFDGRIRFVSGSIDAPAGTSFYVDVGQFLLLMEPTFIF